MNKPTPIFIKEPSGQVLVEPIWHQQLTTLQTKLKSLIGNDAVAYTWYYRCSNLPYLAFDISGSLGECNITIAITGETSLPSIDETNFPRELELELLDAVDAHYFVTSIEDALTIKTLSGPRTKAK
jgi:hypothetical protein